MDLVWTKVHHVAGYIDPHDRKGGGLVAMIRSSQLKQEDGSYTFRETLKSVCILHDGLSLVCYGFEVYFA